MTQIRRTVLSLAGAAALVAPGAHAAPAAAPGGATVQGTVKFAGEKAPKRFRINMEADETCDELHDDPVYQETVVVNGNGTLKNVLVYVSAGIDEEYDPPAEPVTLTQQGCMYHPHVFGIQVGQKLLIRNEDETLHNIHALPEENDGFNFGQPSKGDEAFRTFNYEEVVIPFKCDVHSWMNCYAAVLPHPFFAVTGDDGSFTIPNLPAGEYTITAWHEKYGTAEKTVTVADGATQEIEFSFGG